MRNASDFRRSNTFRAEVRRMLALNYSVARIVKETGKSVVHVTRIVEQERNPTTPQPRTP